MGAGGESALQLHRPGRPLLKPPDTANWDWKHVWKRLHYWHFLSFLEKTVMLEVPTSGKHTLIPCNWIKAKGFHATSSKSEAFQVSVHSLSLQLDIESFT